MNPYVVDWDRYAKIARRTAAEGIVLLQNDNDVLPLQSGQTVSLFGRTQFNDYKSGTGSGGMVNTRYVARLQGAFLASDTLRLNKALLAVYEKWLESHPFEKGTGWAGEPWSQEEMPVTDALAAEAAKSSDIAVVIIGRTAGEDKDNSETPGSYLLTDLETQLLQTVRAHFPRLVVVLNVGNIIDMKWMDAVRPDAVLYTWQGGQETGNAVYDVLTGAVNPSGRLPDTIAESIADYPSTPNFGDGERNTYAEDIYVGYRYFETFARSKVRYPFGYGLSYTRFAYTDIALTAAAPLTADSQIQIAVTVRNAGACAGQDVVQLYLEAPQGRLGKPARALVGFAKTNALGPGETQTLRIPVALSECASYDDGGVTGNRSCYILEAGTYRVYAGGNVRDAALAGSFELPETLVVRRLSEALAPVRPFDRIRPIAGDHGFAASTEPVPLRTVDPESRLLQNRPESRPCTGDRGIRLADVASGKASMAAFLDQLTDRELCCLVRGEGMSSPKVTPGTGSAFGGVTDALKGYGIPLACCTDGPSGLRMDSGAIAFSLPSGTSMACTFNPDLIGELFDMLGREMRKDRVDLLLGPGMNIHRNPLNGRNFEYFSEDPYLTGKMAAAQIRALRKWNVCGTLKHFAANNQEYRRTELDSVVSERALREIYLKGYEIAIREGGAFSVMTTYGAINGIWTAGSYDLLTTILREEWGFDGIAMTDWWAKMNFEGEEAARTNLAAMVRAQNDLYMVVPDSLTHEDNLAQGLKAGRVTRGDLLRCGANICGVILRLAVMERALGTISDEEKAAAQRAEETDGIVFDVDFMRIGKGEAAELDVGKIDTSAGASYLFGLVIRDPGLYEMTFRYRAEAGEMAQIPVSVFVDNRFDRSFVFNGTNGEWVTARQTFPLLNATNQFVKLFFAQGGMELEALSIAYRGAWEDPREAR